MRLPTVLISTAFVLAGTSAALSVEKEGMLVTRFADSGFLSEVEARTYEEPELYTRGCVLSKLPCVQSGDRRPPSFRTPSELTLSSTRQSGHSGLSGTTAVSHPHSYPPLSRPESSNTGTTYRRPPSFRTPSELTLARTRQSDHSGLSGTTAVSHPHSYPPLSRPGSANTGTTSASSVERVKTLRSLTRFNNH